MMDQVFNQGLKSGLYIHKRIYTAISYMKPKYRRTEPIGSVNTEYPTLQATARLTSAAAKETKPFPGT
jgi:hypothetical protein